MSNSAYAERLRIIAAFVDTLPDSIPVPNISREGARLEWDLWNTWGSGYATMPDLVLGVSRAVGGTWAKNDPKNNGYDDTYYVLTRKEKLADDIEVRITTYREQVCERVVVGTEVIEHPAREAYVEGRPIYEYECKPLHEVVSQ